MSKQRPKNPRQLLQPVRSIAERNDLASKHTSLVYWVARSLQRKFPTLRKIDHDDLVGLGWLGLLRAAELYDPSRASFTTYATRWIRSAIAARARPESVITLPCRAAFGDNSATRRQRPLPRAINASDLIGDDNGYDLFLDHRDDSRQQAAERCDELLAKLDANQAALVREHFFDGVPCTVIAKRLGVTHQAVYARLYRALAELKDITHAQEDAASAVGC